VALSDKITALEAALSSAAAANISNAAAADLIRIAMLHPIKDGNRYVASYSIGDRSFSTPIGEAREMHRYFRELAKEDATSGGLVERFAEFRGEDDI